MAMALADYYDRAAIAVSQAIKGFDPEAFRATLERAVVGISFGPHAAASNEGRWLLDLLIRLLARLYPTLAIADGTPSALRGELVTLARAINPAITIVSAGSTITVAVGPDAPAAGATIFVGARGWSATLSRHEAQFVGNSENPLGAGAAACLAAANVFRAVFLTDKGRADSDLSVSLARLVSGGGDEPDLGGLIDRGRTALAGVGGIGNAVLWCLARVPIQGEIHLVDHQRVDLFNLQRYILAPQDSVGREKVLLGAEQFSGPMQAVPHQQSWAEFVGDHAYAWDRVLVALDTPRDRRLLQGSLPRWIANGWTQVGELGLSTHRAPDANAPCLACLYLARGSQPNEDEQVTSALGLAADPSHLMTIRDLLYRGAPPPETVLREVATAKSIAWDVLVPYLTRPLRDLYVDGVCGGGVLPLGSQGPTAGELQVPLAHQSALAGVLVASAYALDVAGVQRDGRQLVRLDLMRRFPPEPTREYPKDERAICICASADAVAAYRAKYPPAATGSNSDATT
jgi:hypothetical protein